MIAGATVSMQRLTAQILRIAVVDMVFQWNGVVNPRVRIANRESCVKP